MSLNIDWSQVLIDLEQAATFVQSPTVTALAALGGPQAVAVADMVQAVAKVSSHVLQTVTDASAAIESGNLETVQAADAKIQAANVVLAQQVAAT